MPMRGGLLLSSFLIIFTTTGCPSAPPIYIRIAPFIESEYARYAKEGTARICGQAFFTTRQGEKKYGTGHEVILKPSTTYSTEWFQERVLAGKELTPPDSRTSQYDRIRIMDSEGQFCFEQLPAGEYYLASYITWKLPVAFVQLFRKMGGWARASVKVGEGETAWVDVTHRE